jgi:hypothetical protein
MEPRPSAGRGEASSAAAAASGRASPRDLGVRLITLYKGAKAVAEVALAAALILLASTGEIEAVREVARELERHVTSRTSVLAGRILARLLSDRGSTCSSSASRSTASSRRSRASASGEGTAGAHGWWWLPPRSRSRSRSCTSRGRTTSRGSCSSS